jgi:hypothetical protein
VFRKRSQAFLSVARARVVEIGRSRLGNEARSSGGGGLDLFFAFLGADGAFGKMRNEATVFLELAESGERFVEAALGWCRSAHFRPFASPDLFFMSGSDSR